MLVSALDQALASEKDVESEFVFVDDGSNDGSWEFLCSLSSRDPRIRAIRFSRNFGSHAALMAGFQQASGDLVAFIAADLQDPPEILPKLIEKWREGYQVAWGTREKRDDPLMTKAFSWLYSSLLRRLALREMPTGGADVCVVDRQVVDVVLKMQEKNTSIFGLIMWSGFRQTFLPYARQARQHGQSKWTLAKKLKLFVDSFVSFSFFPIRLVSYLGLSVSALGFLYAAVVIVRRLLYTTPVEGWSSLMVAVVTLAGVQLLMLGIVAEYLWRTFDESRKRPPYIVREVIGFPAKQPTE